MDAMQPRDSDLLQLHPDAEITALESLPDEFRAQLNHAEKGYLLTHKKSRRNSQLIGESAAGFLNLFRAPRRLAEAVVEHAHNENSDPQRLLDDAFPVVTGWLKSGLLINAGLPDSDRQTTEFTAGTEVLGMTLTDCLRTLEDTEVYRAKDASGNRLIWKRVPADAPEKTKRILRHEAQVLTQLAEADFAYAPDICSSDLDCESPYMILQDVGNQTLEQYVLQTPMDYPSRIELLDQILGAYRALHVVGFLHGDINAANIIVRPDLSVRLIDFGGACRQSRRQQIQRVGVPKYFEPEFAAACIEQIEPPPPSVAGEVYTLANLAYGLVTGHTPIPLSLVHEVLLLQIAQEPMRPFADIGFSGDRVEKVLGKALSKAPAERHRSVAAFHQHLFEALQDEPVARINRHSANRTQPVSKESSLDTMDLYLRQFAQSQADWDRLTAEVQRKTRFGCVYDGAAGHAITLLQLAEHRQDSQLLMAADLWADISMAKQAVCSEHKHPPSVHSVFQSAPGSRFARTLISAALGDRPDTERALAAFMASADGFTAAADDDCFASRYAFDLVNGPLGLLLGAAKLKSRLESTSVIDLSALEQLGDTLYRSFLTRLDAGYPSILQGLGEKRFLGLAHGSMGVLYALLHWHRITQSPDQRFETLLGRFADNVAELSGGTGVLPVSSVTDARNSTHHDLSRPYPGWCHGTAGQAMFWSKAAECFADCGYDRLALNAADYTVRNPSQRNASLCCGLAGQALALTCVAAATGCERYFASARDLTLQAITLASTLPDDGLFKGRHGVTFAVTSVLAKQVPDYHLI